MNEFEVIKKYFLLSDCIVTNRINWNPKSENIKSIDIIYAPRTKKQNIENGYHTIRNEGSKNSKLSAGSLAVITKK